MSRTGDLPRAPGAYILVIDLDTPLAVETGAFRASLAPGRYAYCGSAYGPGGIAARVARHLRRAKRTRWHVDQLTAAGRIVEVGYTPGGRECELLDRVLASADAQIPVPAFGSSDCRRCAAHLAAVAPDFEAAAIIASFQLDLPGAFGPAHAAGVGQ